jgi:hypothetical protein
LSHRWDRPDVSRVLPLRARAARLYLDECYFRPFDDGNARAAFLAVMFLLAREGMMLENVTSLRRISRPAGDAQGAAGLARMLAYSLKAAPPAVRGLRLICRGRPAGSRPSDADPAR